MADYHAIVGAPHAERLTPAGAYFHFLTEEQLFLSYSWSNQNVSILLKD
jgi:hypothetical protein